MQKGKWTQVLTPHPPLDVPTEKFTLGDVHTVPSHSQTQLIQIGRGLRAPTGWRDERERWGSGEGWGQRAMSVHLAVSSTELELEGPLDSNVSC